MTILNIVTLMIGAIGLAFGLYEYHIAQKWKVAEFAGKQLEKLSDDPILARCCLFLDYSGRTMPVPPEYSVFTDEKSFMHDWAVLAKGLLPEDGTRGFEWQEILYRDSFDHFFGYLERINHFISINLIDITHVSSLKYWLEQIAQPRFVESPIFMEFLKAYDYDDVLQLMERFEIQLEGEIES